MARGSSGCRYLLVVLLALLVGMLGGGLMGGAVGYFVSRSDVALLEQQENASMAAAEMPTYTLLPPTLTPTAQPSPTAA